MAKDKSSLPTGRRATVRVKTAKGRTTSSQRWLQRQLNDPYVAEAKAKGYRSRAAFKLIELDDKLRLIRRGFAVIDLGSAPGGWIQVLIARGAGKVAGVDLLAMDPLPLGDVFFDLLRTTISMCHFWYLLDFPKQLNHGSGIPPLTSVIVARAGQSRNDKPDK